MNPLWFRAASSPISLPNQVVKAAANVLVGRVCHEGELLPATVVPEMSCAYISKNGREYVSSEYEILVDDGYSWQSCEFGYFPPQAKDFNTKKNGQQMFIGSVNYKDTVRVGRVDPSQGSIYFPYNGEEVCLRCYNILILDRIDNWISASFHYTPSDAVVCGYHYEDREYQMKYVGRALHDGKWQLVNVIPYLSRAYMSHENEELAVQDYQLLCGNNYRWQKVYERYIPPNAVSIGASSNGQPFYIGRCEMWCGHTVGVISLDKKYLIGPYKRKFYDYEVLLYEL